MQNKIKSANDLVEKAAEIEKNYKDCIEISICSGTGCTAYSPGMLYEMILEELDKNKDKGKKQIIVRKTGCLGFCEKGTYNNNLPGRNMLFTVKSRGYPRDCSKNYKRRGC